MITEKEFITAISGGIGTLLLKGGYDMLVGYNNRKILRRRIKDDLENQLNNLNKFEKELLKVINTYLSSYNMEDELVSTFLNKPPISLKGTNYLDIEIFKASNVQEVHRAFKPKQFFKLKEIYKSLEGIYKKSPLELFRELQLDIEALLKERDEQKVDVNLTFIEKISKYEREFNYRLRTIAILRPLIKKFIETTYYDKIPIPYYRTTSQSN